MNLDLVDFRILKSDKVVLKLNKFLTPKADGYVPALLFDIYDLSDNRVGYIDLRLGFNFSIFYGGSIGYFIDEDKRGNKYAYYACLRLFSLAKELNMKYLYINAHVSNLPSRKTIEKLGLDYLGDYYVPNRHDLAKNGAYLTSIYRIIF